MDQLRLPGDPHGIDEAHDVLAADEFAMPAHGDYGLHLPRDAQDQPHDVLAAEEFAMPSGPDRLGNALKGGGSVSPLALTVAAALAVLFYAAIRRR